MAAPVALLRRVDLFAGVDDADLQELAGLALERRAGRDSPVTSAGSRSSGFFVVAEGQASVRVRGEVRRRLRPGDCFGELALVDGGRRSADVVADTDLRYYGIPERRFREFAETRPQVLWALLEHVVGLLRECQTDDRHQRGHLRLPRRAGR